MVSPSTNLLFFWCSQRSDCLDDIPPVSNITKTPKEFYGKLPGQVVDRDGQCRMIHSKAYYACPQRKVSDRCYT